jgi:phospholipase/carboxylesterase
VSEDTDALLEATTAMVPPLLTALDALANAGRYLHPPNIAAVVDAVAQYRDPLAKGLAAFESVEWPSHLQPFRNPVFSAAGSALQVFDGLASCESDADPVTRAYRSLRFNARAIEALYPVAAMLPPVSRFYLEERYRDDVSLLERLGGAEAPRDDVGIIHASNERNERGGFSLYVPEYYDDQSQWPLVVALHGGSGHGRDFLWTWLREARSRRFLLLSPTSRDSTWSLHGADLDGPALRSMIDWVTSSEINRRPLRSITPACST